MRGMRFSVRRFIASMTLIGVGIATSVAAWKSIYTYQPLETAWVFFLFSLPAGAGVALCINSVLSINSEFCP
jgi:hypothetical protein